MTISSVNYLSRQTKPRTKFCENNHSDSLSHETPIRGRPLREFNKKFPKKLSKNLKCPGKISAGQEPPEYGGEY